MQNNSNHTGRVPRNLRSAFGPYADYLTSDEGHSLADKIIVSLSGVLLWAIVVGLLWGVI